MSARSMRVLVSAALAATTALAGCGANNDTVSPVTPVPIGAVMVTHVSPDAPTANVALDGVTLGAPLDYTSSSAYMNVAANQTHVVATTTTNVTLLDVVVPVATSENVSVFAYDSLAQAKSVVLTDDLSPVPAGKARVRFVNLAAAKPGLDLVRSGAGALFTGTTFGQATGWTLLDAGRYDLEADTTGTAAMYASQTGMLFQSTGIYTVFTCGPGKTGSPKTPTLVTIRHR